MIIYKYLITFDTCLFELLILIGTHLNFLFLKSYVGSRYLVMVMFCIINFEIEVYFI